MSNVSGADGKKLNNLQIAFRLDMKDGRMDRQISKDIWNEFAEKYNMKTTTDENGVHTFEAASMIDTMIKSKAAQENKSTEDIENEILNSTTPREALPDIMMFTNDTETEDFFAHMAYRAGYSMEDIQNMKTLEDRRVVYEYLDNDGNKIAGEFKGDIIKIGNDYYQRDLNDDGTTVLFKVTKERSGLKTYYYRELASEESREALQNFRKENADKAAQEAARKAEEAHKKEVEEAQAHLSTAADGLSSTDSNTRKQALESLQNDVWKLDLPTHKGMTKAERDNIPSYNEYLAEGRLDELPNGSLVKITQSGNPNDPNDGGKIIYGVLIKDNNGNSYLLREAGNEDNNITAYNVYALQGENSYLEFGGQDKRIGQIGEEDNERYVIAE